MEISLSDWASIAEIAGAVAVTVSLMFVGIQIRANTVATQAETLQNTVGLDVQILTVVGSTHESARSLYEFSFGDTNVADGQGLQGL